MPKINPLNNKIAPKGRHEDECAENLIKVNDERALEAKDNEKRVTELLMANKEVELLSQEKNRCEIELAVVGKKLKVEKKKKNKQALELISTTEDLKKAKASEKEHIEGLREMMFMTSHHLRQPVVQILGLADILNTSTNSPEELNEIVDRMKESAESLNDMTKELTTFIHHQEVQAKSKGRK